MADMRKISITEALLELKLYDGKINKALTSAKFVGAKKKSADKVGVFTVKNFEENSILNYNKETINLRNGESSVKKNFGKVLHDLKTNGGTSLFYGKFNKKFKMAKNIAKLFSNRTTKLFTENNNFFENKSKTSFFKYSINMKKSPFNDNFDK